MICGDGDDDDGCTFFSGDRYHARFAPQCVSMNVKFIGFAFATNLHASVAAFGHPLSQAIFHHCTWVVSHIAFVFHAIVLTSNFLILLQLKIKDNDFDMFAIDMCYDPSNIWGRRRRHHCSSQPGKEDEFLQMLEDPTTTSPLYEEVLPHAVDCNNQHRNISNNERCVFGCLSMLLWFNNSHFLDNHVASAIKNEGGILDSQDVTFNDNRVFLAAVGVLFGGHLVMRNNTSFTSNTITFAPVFLDSTSTSQLNAADASGGNQMPMGSNDDGQDCINGIFIEDENSYCLHSGKCLGSCCDFGDDSCNMHVPKDASFHLEDASNPSGDITSTSSAASASASTATKGITMLFQAPSSVIVLLMHDEIFHEFPVLF